MENLQGKSLRSPLAFAQNPQTFRLLRRTIYAAEIETDLRAVFYLEGDVVVTVDIGSHDVYRG